LTSASSSANAFLYVGSRYLFALAQIRQAPRFFLKCNKAGVPVYCVLFTASFSLLTYLSCASGGPTVVFQWFQNLVSVATLFTWCSICIAYIRFNKAMRVQGIDRNTLTYKAPFQPYFAWISFWFFAIVILFSGYSNFTTGNWSVKGFFASYISVLVFVVLYAFWKVFKWTHLKRPMDVDLMTGKAALDAEEAGYVERAPRNFVEKIWFWIA
jgi:amino acid transporter